MIVHSLKLGALWFFGIVAFLLTASLALNAFFYANFDSSYGFLKLKQDAIATGWYLPAYYSHVLVAGIILLIGLFQLNTKISLRWKRVHQILGRSYAYGILFFAAPGGLVMSFFILRGRLMGIKPAAAESYTAQRPDVKTQFDLGQRSSIS